MSEVDTPDVGSVDGSALPDARPAATTITFGFAIGASHRRSVRLEDAAFTRIESMGDRRVSITYDADASTLDDAYATLRAQRFDGLRTHIRTPPRDTGTFLQLRAGGQRHVMNDTGKFEPEPASKAAYAACVTALQPLLPSEPGVAVPLRIEVAPAVTERVDVRLDLGPDLRSAAWQDKDTGVVHVGTRRPVEVVARVGRDSERILVDLSTHAGVTIGAQATMTLLEGRPPSVGGDVPTGLDRRTKAR